MKIEAEELDRWAAAAARLHQAALGRNDTESAMEAGRLMKAMVRAGAADPQDQARAARRTVGTRLDGPAARAYVEAMTAAATAAEAMELERYGHAVDGISEVLRDLADQARFELIGPAGLE